MRTTSTTSSSNSSRGKGFLRGSFVIFLVASSWALLLLGATATGATPTVTVVAASSNGMLKHRRNSIGDDESLKSKRLVYVSKRRVPNGPDPIHNRRDVKTRQPPRA